MTYGNDGGGGFMVGSGGSQEIGEAAKINGLRPVTIRQLIDAETVHSDADFQIDGADVNNVTFVAVLRNVTPGATNTTFLCEDGTGQIEVRKWSADGVEIYRDMDTDVYVRVCGTLKTFSGKRHVSGNTLHIIEDKNEVAFHIAHAVYVHLMLTRGPPAGSVARKTAPPARSVGNVYDSNNDHGANSSIFQDLRGMQKKIMIHISSLGDDTPGDGVHVDSIRRAVGGDMGTVRSEVETLVSEGHLYNSIDDDHVLSTA
ncbi:replication factor A2, partial [Phenoliferia sp. Uapishka_3]